MKAEDGSVRESDFLFSQLASLEVGVDKCVHQCHEGLIAADLLPNLLERPLADELGMALPVEGVAQVMVGAVMGLSLRPHLQPGRPHTLSR